MLGERKTKTGILGGLILCLGMVWSGFVWAGESPSAAVQKKAVRQLQLAHTAAPKERILRGVGQVAKRWTKQDGSQKEFMAFCQKYFASGPGLDRLFARFERQLEQIEGRQHSLALALRWDVELDTGPLLPVDGLFAAYDPASHLVEDLFANKLAFVALLNFPLSTLAERIRHGSNWSRRQWAESRLAAHFSHRIPAAAKQNAGRARSVAASYIYGYNIHMGQVVDSKGTPLFKKDMRLISHWGLRDQLKALYSDPQKNLSRQEIIQVIMKRIIDQSIPAAVIDQPEPVWDPVANTVDGKPSAREADVRYRMVLDAFHALRALDAFYPDLPSFPARSFELEREIPRRRFLALLEEVLRHPVGKQIAPIIKSRLGRDLRPFDIWYDGFKARSGHDVNRLDSLAQKKYPSAAAYDKDLPQIFAQLGFDSQTAAFLADTIKVEASRGAGHAWEPKYRDEQARLRTRVAAKGMDYLGFNIAMHELGHNVEQVFSLYRLDHTLLAGVPNSAFSESFAFMFQRRDLEILGAAGPAGSRSPEEILDLFWSTREIAGVGLVDARMWQWLYAHPQATPAQLRQAVARIARKVWNQYFAPVFGVKDSPLLAIYSHIIAYPLYSPNYALGKIIGFQVEDHFKNHPLAAEMERMCALGRIGPNLWMKQAVNSQISTQPLIQATQQAVKVVGQQQNPSKP